MIVVDVPRVPRDATREGTLLKTKILETLATDSTIQGSKFTAEVTEPIERNGRVIIPVGSILEGRVTDVHGGKRITGGALLHLETSDVLLPDGTHYIVHAQIINTGKSDFNVTNEGTLKKKGNGKETLAVIGGVTGAVVPRVESDDWRRSGSDCRREYRRWREHHYLVQAGSPGYAAEGRFSGVQFDDADDSDSAEWVCDEQRERQWSEFGWGGPVG